MFTERLHRHAKRRESGVILPKVKVDGMAMPYRTDFIDLPDTLDPEVFSLHNMGDGLISREEGRVLTLPSASSLYDACMRMHVIATKSPNPVHKKRYPSVRSGIIFGVGDAVHYWIQNTPTVFGNSRVGWWECSACTRVLYFGKPPMKNCPHCDASTEAMRYKEHHMIVKPPYPMSGHPDLFLELTNGWIVIIEIKTISSALFKALKGPDAVHEFQLLSYMFGMTKDETLPKIPKMTNKFGFVLYVSKEDTGKGNFPMRMYKVNFNSTRADRVKKRLSEYNSGIEGYPTAIPAPKKECLASRWGSYQAKTCPTKDACVRLHNAS